MTTPHRRTTDRPREHLRGWRPLALVLIAIVAVYGLLLKGWLS